MRCFRTLSLLLCEISDYLIAVRADLLSCVLTYVAFISSALPKIIHWWHIHTTSACCIILTTSSFGPLVVIILLCVSVILNPSLFFFPFYYPYPILSSSCIVLRLYFHIFSFILFNKCFKNYFSLHHHFTGHVILYFLLLSLLKLVKCQAANRREEAVYSYK